MIAQPALATRGSLAYVGGMTERAHITGTWADRIADALLRGLIALMRALPYGPRVRLTGWLVARVIGPLAGYRRRALANLALIHPDWPQARRRQVARAALDNFGRTLIEGYSGPELAARIAATPRRGEGWQALEEARAAGRPVIFVSGHFGNHEAARHQLQAQGFVTGGIYRAMGNPFFNAHYVGTLAAVSGPVFERGRGTAGFVRHLRGGGRAVILFDVHDTNGIPVDFLGQPAMTATSAADLALRYGAVVIPYFAVRRADGLSFDIWLERPIAPGSPAAMMRAMTDRLEARIAADPGQWFWVHRRWKPPKRRNQRQTSAATINPGPGS